MSFEEIYNTRLMTADEAVKTFVKNGDKIFIGGLSIATPILSSLLDKIKNDEYKNISAYGNLILSDIGLNDARLTPDKFRYYSFFNGKIEREGAKYGSVTHVPLHLSHFNDYFKHVSPDIAIVPMTPPNEQGYCNVGPAGYASAGITYSNKIVAVINKNIPRVYGSNHDYHVNDISGFVEFDEPVALAPSAPPSELENKIASYILEQIPDGACIQLGIGGTANAVGYGLKDKKHLGIHSEMYTDSMAYLQKIGVVDNSCKSFMPRRSIGGFSMGTQETLDFIANNPKVYYTPYEYVNDIRNIAANDNMISINTSLSIDLTGQMCSESIGFRQFSGSGGQVDYIRGATLSKGGKSFIAVSSVANTKNGPVSKICLSLAAGSTITTLRAEVMNIATEYGCVNLQYCDIPTRAKKLISIAHPDFRDELTFEAKKNGLIY
ncbi:MAG: acetyl-CoA hydrolase/transferase C-terminal domain-containing protein [Candidatus Metalachnospira sp.]|nr:acetyl-CoA hydrolase/transferase C-terminal domain-containing protein [Candidatus Metalachnospira sp.]